MEEKSIYQIHSVFGGMSRRLFIGGALGTAVSATTAIIPYHKLIAPGLYANYLKQLGTSLATYILPPTPPLELVSEIFNLKNAMRAILLKSFHDASSEAERLAKIEQIVDRSYHELVSGLSEEDIKIIHSVHNNPVVKGMKGKFHEMGMIVSANMHNAFVEVPHELIFSALKTGNISLLSSFTAPEIAINDSIEQNIRIWMELSVLPNLDETVKTWCKQLAQRRGLQLNDDLLNPNLNNVAAFMSKVIQYKSFHETKLKIAPEDLQAAVAVINTPNYKRYLRLGWTFDRSLYGITMKFAQTQGQVQVEVPKLS